MVGTATLKLHGFSATHGHPISASYLTQIQPKFHKVHVLRKQKKIQHMKIYCMNSESNANAKTPARSAHMLQILQDAEKRAAVASDPVPRISLGHVTVTFARSGGPGGQNVNKGKKRINIADIFRCDIAIIGTNVNTKVDMRFNVAAADWLSPWMKERIMQMEKNRVNSDGELVISSTKTRTQKGNIEDAMAKLQAIIDAAAYVPPPPSEETKKKIKKLAAVNNEKRLRKKKAVSQKKAMRRGKGSWDS